MSQWNDHPGVRTGNDLTRAERVADASVRGMGSWHFITGLAVFLAAWIVLNMASWVPHWDESPFVLLNLVLGVLAAFSAPLILVAQRRVDQRNAEVAMHTMRTGDEIKAAVDRLTALIESGVITPADGRRLMED
ncbi:DUF1003 domain-containing protein [Nocardia terpenica]|uniref:DUF1003 domain-containing protein n=1 Tax=Nocardia terpenica TaxID=455432 RepID=UPI0018948D93|nr:DUF1003 domain-containing protein [Nocardia terpenica]MBF6060519.1 DUF1003 domain-containing protein [Nocardia terpenica]MBF6103779.1 DUF1003 domain-containing protein [Nocardia terpenica]MBF6111847.1 DUF1003 domain-containing protein [Nocardia terpenica]MBF6118000.1 DUF1003 domain-containing protein [Nocardia terpenica]MBF6155274.1 DUF1003 domain-containing protein [Nocardia terpenica]